MARCLLLESNLPHSLWSEAINTSAYIRNRCTTKVLNNKTPYEYWFGRKPSVSHLRTFGCLAVALDKKPGRSKLHPKGKKFTFVGYSLNTKGYRLYDNERKIIVVARDVLFFENSKYKSDDTLDTKDKVIKSDYDWFDVSFKPKNVDAVNQNNLNGDEDPSEEISEDDYGEIGVKRKRGRPRIERTGLRGRPKKLRLVETTDTLNKLAELKEDPNTVKDAMESKNSSNWRKAMETEFNILQNSGTWELVEKPNNKNIIGCKWVFVTKRDPMGKIEKYKARLVAQGFSQKHKVDYTESFSPVVKYSTIRMLFALAVQRKMLINHVDVVSAYLNGELQEEVYMRQPQMFIDDRYPDYVCKLKKSIYGLKQAGRDWYRKINQILINLNFVRCKTENCLYSMRSNDELILLAIYVDDILLLCSSEKTMKKVVFDLNQHVDVIDRGPVKYYLGMEIERDGLRGNITIHQAKYTKDLLEQWNMTNCKPSNTPLAAGTVLEKCQKENCSGYESKKYQSLIGSLMYLAVISRPDIAHIVSKLSQFNLHPEKQHFLAAKHILRYLKHTPKGTLNYNGSNGLVCYTDADWGSDVNDRKSYSGYVLFLAGGPISWESKKQKIVSLSSMEAESVAMC